MKRQYNYIQTQRDNGEHVPLYSYYFIYTHFTLYTWANLIISTHSIYTLQSYNQVTFIFTTLSLSSRSQQRTESPTNNPTASPSLHTASRYIKIANKTTTRLLPPMSRRQVTIPSITNKPTHDCLLQSPDNKWLFNTRILTENAQFNTKGRALIGFRSKPPKPTDQSVGRTSSLSPRVHGRVQRG
jgi:hypothetical protein